MASIRHPPGPQMTPGFIEPCLPMMSRTVPTGAGWAYEIKRDGFRFICRRDDERVRLFSRGSHRRGAEAALARLAIEIQLCRTWPTGSKPQTICTRWRRRSKCRTVGCWCTTACGRAKSLAGKASAPGPSRSMRRLSHVHANGPARMQTGTSGITGRSGPGSGPEPLTPFGGNKWLNLKRLN